MTILSNIQELATCPPNDQQADIGTINDAALVYQDDQIVWTGKQSELPDEYRGDPQIDCSGQLVIPGLVDCHTHLCFGGWRGDEFELRIQGKTYLEIAKAGGGIASTVQATRQSSQQELLEKASSALDGMLDLGVTTVECKSGYGLDEANELKQLRVYHQLNQQHPIELVSTFLGAHIIPPEYSGHRQDYINLLCDQLIPQVSEQKLAEFCDCYIDAGAYTVDEGRAILECAQAHGLKLKIHAEQISHTGAATLAAELNAISAEHLEHIDDAGIEAMAQSGTVAVSLPLASLYLREDYMQARRFIDAGIPVAVATDFNPGSAPSYHLPFAMTLACLNQQMTPAEVLKGSTAFAARAVNREKRIGSLLPGYQADIAVINVHSVNHWLYHAQSNACSKVIKAGQLLRDC